MNILRSVDMAFSMFSRIPMPQIEWKKENMQYMLAVFPLVGAVLSAILYLYTLLGNTLGFGDALFAAGMTVLPVLYTGGVHLDGFSDTIDALSSHADPEKKREILKDSHCGAFAVIFAAAYLIAEFALFTEVPRTGKELFLVLLIPVMGRTLSGFASINFPVYNGKGLLHTFHSSAAKKPANGILLAIACACAAAALYLSAPLGIAVLLAGILAEISVYFMSRKQFGGMSGDIAGYLLEIAEIAMLAVFVVVRKVMLL